jgi:hypothetical protein
MNELKDLLYYPYVLQPSIEYIKCIHPFQSDVIVYRGLQTGGKKLIPLYVSMIGEIIVWSSFCGAHRETEIM